MRIFIFETNYYFTIFAEAKGIKMISDISLRVTPEECENKKKLETKLKQKLSISQDELHDWKIVRKSIDARQKNVMINITVRIAAGDDKSINPLLKPIKYSHVLPDAEVIVIIGAGPAGLFAALKAIELGIKPILLERGKKVEERRVDIADISRSKTVNPTSNYCFGEGGAGAFSDGKLFTRSKKRGNVEEILQILVQHGASDDILIDSHPHIGSDKLPKIIANIRKTILDNGGEIHFSTKAEKLIIEEGSAKGVITDDGKFFKGAVILAIGHSARDTIRNLHSQGVKMEPKGFAMGVRLEHPQNLIDRLQYHNSEGRGKYLPAAEYNFVTQVDGRGVYSFCMCPGGVIVPASSAEGESVVNGMSASARAGKWANSGMVVEIRPGDFPDYSSFGDLELLQFQEDVEKKVYEESSNTLEMPSQIMTDFVAGKKSETTLPTSYAPGIYPADMDKLLPGFISKRLREGFLSFNRKCRGFISPDAQLIGLESRTSSPVRLPRNKDTLCHEEIKNLYPAGEGAGYAGGIVSAAIDGSRCVESFARAISIIKE